MPHIQHLCSLTVDSQLVMPMAFVSRSRWVAIVVLACVGIGTLTGCDDQDLDLDELLRLNDFPYLRPQDKVIADSVDVNGGAVVVESGEDSLYVVFVENINFEVDEGGAIDIVLDSLGRAGPFSGNYEEFECLFPPDGRVPERPDEEPPNREQFGEDSLRFREAIRGYVRRQEENRARYILVTSDVVDGDTVNTIRTFDAVGRLLVETTVAGRFRGAFLNMASGHKLFVTNINERQRFALVDYVTGQKLGESNDQTDLDGSVEIVDIEFLAGRIIILERWRGNTQVRIRILGLDGREFFVIEVPGEFVRAVDDGRKLKFIATIDRRDTPPKIYAELLDILSGQSLLHPQGLPLSFITGDTLHIQHDSLSAIPPDGRLDRFVAAVYNSRRDETDVRIVDASGREIVRHVLVGKQTSPFAIRQIGECKVFMLQQGSEPATAQTHVYTVNLRTGARIGTLTRRGEYRSNQGNLPGPLRVHTSSGTIDVPLGGCR